MNRRLEFLFPDVKSAQHAWKALLLACVNNDNIHFISNPDIKLGKMLHRANVFESRDVIHQGVKGTLLGAFLGLLIGLLTLATQPWYSDTHWTGVLAITTFTGAVAGAVWLAMLGACFTNSDLDKAKEQIGQGQIMMIVSVPLSRVEEICELLNKLPMHPQQYDIWPSRYQLFP